MTKILNLAAILTLSIPVAGSAFAQDAGASGPEGRFPVEKVESEGVWQPGPDGTQIPLWASYIPLAKPDTGDRPEATGNGSTTIAGRKWHWAGYVTRPTMTIYQPTAPNTGAAMLVLPGGGFHAVAMDLEGTEICDWIVEQGITCALLKYRAPQRWERVDGVAQRPEVLLPLEDAQRAMSLLRHRSAEFSIDNDRIGVIGFSAGAYLAANLSNTGQRTYPSSDAADSLSSRPDFAVILYTARLWEENNESTDLSLEPWVEISSEAPPTLLIHAMDDPVDDIRHAFSYALALKEANVPVDLRIYAEGGHAFGLRPTQESITTQWTGQVEQWLRNIGVTSSKIPAQIGCDK